MAVFRTPLNKKHSFCVTVKFDVHFNSFWHERTPTSTYTPRHTHHTAHTHTHTHTHMHAPHTHNLCRLTWSCERSMRNVMIHWTMSTLGHNVCLLGFNGVTFCINTLPTNTLSHISLTKQGQSCASQDMPQGLLWYPD